MKRDTRLWISVLGALSMAFVGATAGFVATPFPAAAAEVQSSIVRGGKLYDKWYKVIKAEAPKKAHPAYPADKKYAKKPKSNWRCKECHGWDTMGKGGAYATGKHSTGIKGITGMAGADPAKIVVVLKDKTHGYAGKMDEADFQDLALFVSKGQVDMGAYIDRATKKPKGDKTKGEVYFNTLCAQCHGKDGLQPKDMKPMGKLDGQPVGSHAQDPQRPARRTDAGAARPGPADRRRHFVPPRNPAQKKVTA